MNFLCKSEIIDYDYFYNTHNETILFLHGWGGNKFSFDSEAEKDWAEILKDISDNSFGKTEPRRS